MKLATYKEKRGKVLFFWGLLLLESLLMIVLIFDKNIFMDEAFTIALAEHPWKDIISLTAADVHPPVYYLILKLFTSIFGSSIILQHLVSVIPMILLLILGCTLVRKRFGDLTAFIFMLSIFGMPKMLAYGTEIRMYSWAMFFVTAAALYAYEITKIQSFKNWCLFTIFSLMAAYTHYFACVAVAFLYLYLLIFIIKRERKSIKSFLFCCITTVILYLPWLSILLRQVQEVNQEYWIPPITLSSLFTYVQYLFSVRQNIPLSGILLLVFFVVFLHFLFRKKTDEDWFAAAALSTLVGMVLVGILISWIMRPVFYQRYMIAAIGCMWLFFAIEFKHLKYTVVRWGCLFYLVICSLFNFTDQFQSHYFTGLRELDAFVESNWSPGDRIFYTHSGVQKCLAYYYPYVEHTLYREEIPPIYQKVYKNYPVDSLMDIGDLDNDASYWIVTDPDISSDILSDFTSAGYQYDYIGDYSFDEYQLSIYRLLSQ